MPALYVFLMPEELKRKLLHFFFPNKCPICGEVLGADGYFCKSCTSKLNVYSGLDEIDGAAGFFAAFEYDDISSKGIYLLKSGNGTTAGRAYGHYLACVLRDGLSDKLDIITAVPVHKKKKRLRGYNQSEIIAETLSEELGVPCDFSFLVKEKKTPDQKTLSSSERKANVKNAYSVISPEKIKGRTLLLIDDICTTGSTLKEITALLLENGAERVYCAACCKTPPKDKKGVH